MPWEDKTGPKTGIHMGQFGVVGGGVCKDLRPQGRVGQAALEDHRHFTEESTGIRVCRIERVTKAGHKGLEAAKSPGEQRSLEAKDGS